MSIKTTGKVILLTSFLAFLVTAVSVPGCFDPKERLNPLDPNNPQTGGDPFQLKLTQEEITDDTGVVYQNRLEWHDVNHQGLEEYHVLRRQGGSFFTVFEIQEVLQPGDTIYQDQNLDPNLRYFYKVSALFAPDADSVISETVESYKFQ